MSEYVEVQYEQVIRKTDAAVLVLIDGEDVWLPWTQIEDNGEDLGEGAGVLYLKRWLAQKKDIPYD